MDKIKFDGKPSLNRDRKVSEQEFTIPADLVMGDIIPKTETDPRQTQTDELFTDLARTYIKGNVVKKGLSKMEPAQEIPIDEWDEKTRASARRLNITESRDGTVITYSMYQAAVDYVLDKNWENRLRFLTLQAPGKETVTNNNIETNKSYSEAGNLLKEFFEQNGIAGTILSMLTLAPFQSVIFQALTVEEGAKLVQAGQILGGIAIFIELGIKAEKIYNLLKKSKINYALTEAQIVELEKDEVARSIALQNVGIDHTELKQSLELTDHETLINYVSEFYRRNAGLLSTNSHLTIDHWIAYLDVSRNQQSLRGALNTADSYSQKFKNIRSTEITTDIDFVDRPADDKLTTIHVDMASVLRELNSQSIEMYDDIVNAFTYQVTDRAMCCLVSILGATRQSNIDLLRTMAVVLRILATDLAGNIIELDNIARRFIAKKLHSAMFELMLQFNQFYDKIQRKLSSMFTIEIPGLENCQGMLTLGYAINKAFEVIYKQLSWLIRDIMSSISSYGEIEKGSWQIVGDRRHLLSVAKILEILADRIELANICANSGDQQKDLGLSKQDIKDEAARNVIHQLIEKSPPSIQITDEEYSKYFNNIESTTSKNLNIKYGIPEIQQQMSEDAPCADLSEQQLDSIAEKFWESARTSFSE